MLVAIPVWMIGTTDMIYGLGLARLPPLLRSWMALPRLPKHNDYQSYEGLPLDVRLDAPTRFIISVEILMYCSVCKSCCTLRFL